MSALGRQRLAEVTAHLDLQEKPAGDTKAQEAAFGPALHRKDPSSLARLARRLMRPLGWKLPGGLGKLQKGPIKALITLHWTTFAEASPGKSGR